MIRIASPNPPLCSVCYGSWPELRHVDFDAATDGPVVFLRDSGEVVGFDGDRVQVDDIIVCENCMRVGLEALDLSPSQRREFELRLEAAQAETALWMRRCEALQTAMSEFGPVPAHADEPAPGPEPDLTPVDPVLQEPFEPTRSTGRVVGRAGYPQEFRDRVVVAARRGNISKAARDHNVSVPTVTRWMEKENHVV